MKICQIVLLFLVLCDGRPGLTRATVYKVTEGGNITATCQFDDHGTFKFFCKNDCDKPENILVKTSDNIWQDGRYSFESDTGLFTKPVLSVSITNVSSSDSGRYSCGLETWTGGMKTFSFKEFFIDVISAPTPEPSLIHDSSGTTLSSLRVTHENSSSPGHPQQQHTALSGVLLYVALAAVVIILSATFLTLYWKKRTTRAEGPSESTPCAQILEANPIYEEITDGCRPLPVETCTAIVSTSFRKPTETSLIYSLACAPNGQLEVTDTEDSSSKATYSELDFTNSSSAPQESD